MTFKIENLEIDEEGNMKVDLPQESLDLLLRMFPDAETPEEAFRHYLTLAYMNREAYVRTAAEVLTNDPLEDDDHES